MSGGGGVCEHARTSAPVRQQQLCKYDEGKQRGRDGRGGRVKGQAAGVSCFPQRSCVEAEDLTLFRVLEVILANERAAVNLDCFQQSKPQLWNFGFLFKIIEF